MYTHVLCWVRPQALRFLPSPQIQSVLLLCLILIILFLFAQSVRDLRMGRDDEPVDSMEIDGQQQLKVEGPAAVPDGFNADYLRVYYGKAIRSLLN